MAGDHGDYVNNVCVTAMSASSNRPARCDFSQIDGQASQHSFFLYVADEAVHLPFQTPADTVETRSKKKLTSKEMWDPKRIRPKYKIMLEEMDKGIGKILDTVRSEGIAENTFIFFCSDNGAIGAGGSNKPFRGGKFSNYEGGHRVPAIAWWPGRIDAGTSTDATTVAMDLLPTIMDFADIAVPRTRKLDGTSMAKLMLNQADFPDRKLFWGYEPKLGTAMRDRHWKMQTKGDVVELYDLSQDIKETNNVADKHLNRTKEMRAAIEKWKQEVTPQTAPHREAASLKGERHD